MRKPTPVDEILKQLKEKFGDSVTMDTSTYKKAGKVARFIINGEEYFNTPFRVLKGVRKKGLKQIVPLELVKQKLYEVHGGSIKIIDSSYRGVRSKATFFHEELGTWEAEPRYVILGHSHTKTISKIMKTNNPMWKIDIALKNAKSNSKAEIKKHWKTGESLVCVGSYESKVVDFLNSKNIPYQWQPRIFQLGKRITYRPDLYLEAQDKWIEIKGFFRKDAELKWNLFKTKYPNSELWDLKILKEMDIL